jgi:hypothetical protein
MKFRHVAGAGIGVLLSSTAVAANSKAADSPLIRGVVDCRRQTEDAARLRCYDAAAAALAAAAASGKVVVVDREDVRRTRRSLFGFSVPKLPFFSGDDSANDQQDELTAKIASARSLGYDKYQIRLEDGGLWETTEGSSAVNEPRKGDTVTIKRGPLGSYMMRIAGQRGLRAKRVG